MWYIYIFVNKGIEDGLKGHIRYIIMDGPKGHIRYTSMDISLSQPPTFKSQGGYELKIGDWDTADVGRIPDSGKSPGGGNANPLQYSCLKTSWMEESGRLKSVGSHSVHMQDWKIRGEGDARWKEWGATNQETQLTDSVHVKALPGPL